jgi:hypothetical protein
MEDILKSRKVFGPLTMLQVQARASPVNWLESAVFWADDRSRLPSLTRRGGGAQCCPTSDGAAAAVVCSEEFVKKHNLQHQARVCRVFVCGVCGLLERCLTCVWA